MSTPKPPELVTRILVLDGEVFHVVFRGAGLIVGHRLDGETQAMALKMLNDCHFEIGSHLAGARPK